MINITEDLFKKILNTLGMIPYNQVAQLMREINVEIGPQMVINNNNGEKNINTNMEEVKK